MINYQEMLKNIDYSKPFPFAVFGTLRRGFSNHYLMNAKKAFQVYRGVLPGFITEGLWLVEKKGATCPVEIYCYEKQIWDQLIYQIDLLEGFYPCNKNLKTYVYADYERTLADVKIIPDNYKVEFPGLRIRKRDLNIPVEEWSKWQSIPCWIYSNCEANHKKPDSVIWTGSRNVK